MNHPPPVPAIPQGTAYGRKQQHPNALLTQVGPGTVRARQPILRIPR